LGCKSGKCPAKYPKGNLRKHLGIFLKKLKLVNTQVNNFTKGYLPEGYYVTPNGESNGHVTDDGHVTLKGQTRDPNTLRAQYLENAWKQILCSKRPPIGNVPWRIEWSR